MELQALIYEAKKGSKAAEEVLFCRLSDTGAVGVVRHPSLPFARAGGQ